MLILSVSKIGRGRFLFNLTMPEIFTSKRTPASASLEKRLSIKDVTIFESASRKDTPIVLDGQAVLEIKALFSGK
jgi:hypothetical protein